MSEVGHFNLDFATSNLAANVALYMIHYYGTKLFANLRKGQTESWKTGNTQTDASVNAGF